MNKKIYIQSELWQFFREPVCSADVRLIVIGMFLLIKAYVDFFDHKDMLTWLKEVGVRND